MPFTVTDFEGLYIFEPRVFEDERGYFYESYNDKVFREYQIDSVFIQDNQSFSKYGVIRGLHYQRPPHAQTKLVRVLTGAVLDVVVDLRTSSRSFGRTLSIELSAENKRQLFIPKGFAHGFSVLTPQAEVMYKCDCFYNKESESGILFNDPDLQIDWKVPASKQIVSSKDLQLPRLREIQKEF